MKHLIVRESKKARNRRIIMITIIMAVVGIYSFKNMDSEFLIIGPISVIVFTLYLVKELKAYNKEKILLDIREEGIGYFCEIDQEDKFVKWDYIYGVSVAGKGIYEKTGIAIGDIPYEYAGDSPVVQLVEINTKFGDVSNKEAADIILAKLQELERDQLVLSDQKVK